MYTVTILIAFLLLSTVVHHLILKAEIRRHQPPGKLIELDGHRMHIAGSGSGQPTIVMTCGNGAPCAITEFYPIASKLSGIARTCIYERPGYGWSNPTSVSRDTEQIVCDLKRLLEKAGEKPPYLFVAHSMGAMEVLLYTHKYPGEVTGIVLVDGTSPYKHIHYPKLSIPNIGIQFIRFINFTGLLRIANELHLNPLVNCRMKYLPKNIGIIDKVMIYKNLMNNMIVREGEPLESIALKWNGNIDIKNKPLIIYSADSSLKKLPGWYESQKSLAELSANSKHVIVKNSNHITILHKHWEEITGGIEELLRGMKAKEVNQNDNNGNG